MCIEPETGSVSIVLVGEFNPSILTPSWFGWQGLLTPEDVKAVRLEVAHPEILKFEAKWFSLEVTSEKFVSQTPNAPFVRLKDLVVRVFSEQLRSTPIRALGINREVHFRAADTDARDRVRRMLAPVEAWGDWGKRLEFGETNSGLSSMTMSQLNPAGRNQDGSINVTVGTSKQLGPDRLGIYVYINDHYSLQGLGNLAPNSSDKTMNLLNKEFEESIRRSDGIIDHVMSLTRST